MPFYHKLGEIPHKRHVQFRKPGGGLYREEVMGLEGFSSLQSILYHYFLPPRVKEIADLGPAKPEYVDFGPIRHRAFRTAQLAPAGDPLKARIPLLGNNDVILSVSAASESMANAMTAPARLTPDSRASDSSPTDPVSHQATAFSTMVASAAAIDSHA